MKTSKRAQRRAEIEQAASELLEEHGFERTSIAEIAKRTKASNETLYRWYGDRNGLFAALVRRNAEDIRAQLEQAIAAHQAPRATLEAVAPLLLTRLVGRRAVALNRAAAADTTGSLSAALAREGRQSVVPLIEQVLSAARLQGELAFSDSEDAAGLFVDLLIGDLQIRRVAARMPQPEAEALQLRAQRAVDRLYTLLAPSAPSAGAQPSGHSP